MGWESFQATSGPMISSSIFEAVSVMSVESDLGLVNVRGVVGRYPSAANAPRCVDLSSAASAFASLWNKHRCFRCLGTRKQRNQKPGLHRRLQARMGLVDSFVH
jgi:hypothetical protein